MSIVAAGCARGADDAPELLVAAASDLALAMPELAAAFEAGSGVRVVATIGASGQLAQQIIGGAPVDVFLSADGAWVQRLADAGRIRPDSRTVYARGSLVLVSAPRRSVPFERVEELAAADVRRIAIANPAFAPYGRAARQALERSGIWMVVEPRIVIAENVRQALQFVATGNVDAALIARALIDERAPPWVPIDERLHDPLLQEAAAVARRPREADAVAFLEFLTGDAGRATLARHHFTAPDAKP